MTVRIPERNKKPGVCYAVTHDGIELPVVDVTHDAFAFEPSEAELSAVADATLRRLNRSKHMPGFVRRFLARSSVIVRGTMEAEGSVLSGITTYLLKLGPENLGRGYAGSIDRRLARSISPMCIRLRLRGMARLIADGLARDLAADPHRPLHLLNIAGGSASDTLNALILLRKGRPESLAERAICISVLDSDDSSPRFAARCLAALLAEGGPLHGLSASLKHVRYDWTEVSVLRDLLDRIRREDELLAACSEGGLLEYASDKDIVSNLNVLKEGTASECFLVASALRNERLTREFKAVGKMPLRLLELGSVRALLGDAGWVIDRTIEGNPMYHLISAR
jgi:hypothetical protein